MIAAFLTHVRSVVIYGIVFVERAQRSAYVIQYPKRQIGGNKMFGGESSHMPLKINTSGVIPLIFASSLLLDADHGDRSFSASSGAGMVGHGCGASMGRGHAGIFDPF